MLNSIVFQGRMVKDAELRYTQTNKAVATFTLACDRGKDKGADFIPCVAWEKTATMISQYFRKGDMMLVQGRLQQRNFTDNSGNKRTAYEVVVSGVNFCGGKSSDAGNEYKPTFVEVDDDDGEIPF